MKIPQNIEGIYREGRTDSFTSATGVEPLWIRDKIKKAGKYVWRKRKCIARCSTAPGWGGKAACVAQC